MSDTKVNCSLALGGAALVVAGATGLYCKSNITHLTRITDVHENDISALFGEMKSIKDSVKSVSLTDSALEGIYDRMDELERKLTDVLHLLEAPSHRSKPSRKHTRVDNKEVDRGNARRRHKKEDVGNVDTDDPEYIIRMVREESRK